MNVDVDVDKDDGGVELPLSHLGFSDKGVPVATVRLGSEGVSIALMPSPPVVRDVSPRLSTSVLI